MGGANLFLEHDFKIFKIIKWHWPVQFEMNDLGKENTIYSIDGGVDVEIKSRCPSVT